MKGKMKVLSLLLASAMAATMFAGCNNSSNPASDGGTSTASTGSTASTAGTDEGGAAPSGEIVEINWYAYNMPPNAADRVIPELNKKTEADIGIRVNYLWQSAQQEGMLTAFAAGDSSIDLAFACNWFADYVGSAQKNYFYDITEKVQSVTPTLYSTLPAQLWEGMKINGKIYGVPTWKDAAADTYWTARKDIIEGANAMTEFQAAGERAATLTPVLEKVKAWHDADPDNNAYSEGLEYPYNFNKTGINPVTPDWDTLSAPLWLGIKLDGSDSTTVQFMFDDPGLVEDFKTLKDWADRGLSNGKIAPQIEQEPTVLVVSSAQGWDGAQYTAWGGPTKGYDCIIQHRAGPFLTSNYVQGGANVIGSASKKADAALKFLEYVNTNEEFRNMLAFGVEGDTFTRDELGKVTKSPDWDTSNFAIGSMNILWPESNLPDDQLNVNQKICDMVNTAEASPLMGFSIDISSVENQIAACTSIVKEYAEQLRCGVVTDVDASIAELKDKVNKQGMQDVITEFQKQVDAFIASK